MAGRDYHARDAAQVPHGIAEHGHGTQRIKQIRLDPRRAQRQRRLAGKLRAHVAAVIGNGYTALRPAGEGMNIGGQPARGAAHHIHVHAVGAIAQHAAHARRAKSQLSIKTIFNLFFIRHGGKLRHQRVVIGKIVQPLRVYSAIIHISHATYPLKFPT